MEHKVNGGKMVDWIGDPRLIRLFDLARDDRIIIGCRCGNCRDYGSDFFQRNIRFASDMLLFDLRYRVGKCSECGRLNGFGVEVRKRTYPEQPSVVVVACDTF